MKQDTSFFFCGIGGSGMLPLALIVKARGHKVAGSDRSLDQGRTPEKFDFLRRLGIPLFPQDGSGVTDSAQVLVTSAAVEATVRDVQAARAIGAREMIRAELLAQLFNSAPTSIGIAGTSGKSTTTGMIGWILHHAGLAPDVVNGAVMKNFVTPDIPFAGAIVGQGDIFVAEVDESDGSIARYSPTIALVNNVALDHKSMEELRRLFADFVGKARVSVLNWDNEEARTLGSGLSRDKVVGYSLAIEEADLFGHALEPRPDGIDFSVTERATGATARIRLQVPGRHNVANALAALAAARAAGLTLAKAAQALEGFAGIRRRLEVAGTAGGVTVIDDFAHNPDKIAATLATLHGHPGRLLVMFQPHGFGPLKLMKDGFIGCFGQDLGKDDVLVMPDPVYFGGTVDRAVTSADIAAGVAQHGHTALALDTRAACGEKLLEMARPGDRIIIMGARDDTLTQFAAELLERLER